MATIEDLVALALSMGMEKGSKEFLDFVKEERQKEREESQKVRDHELRLAELQNQRPTTTPATRPTALPPPPYNPKVERLDQFF